MTDSKWKNQITIRRVVRADWSWISTWFEDEWLNRELGPIDEVWREHVLSEQGGVQLVAEVSTRPVGLIGVTWATKDNPLHGITDLAINPSLRRQGLGTAVLSAAMNWQGHPKATCWVAYVDRQNEPPAELLISVGWSETKSDSNMRKFIIGSRTHYSIDTSDGMPVDGS